MRTLLRQMAARIQTFIRPDAPGCDFDEELQSHLEMLEEDNLRRGWPRRMLGVPLCSKWADSHNFAKRIAKPEACLRWMHSSARAFFRLRRQPSEFLGFSWHRSESTAWSASRLHKERRRSEFAWHWARAAAIC